MAAGAFHGGLRLAGQREAAARPIRPCPLPPALRIALRQHPGPPPVPEVQAGDPVRAGQRIARAAETGGPALHAPCDGRVLAIEGDGVEAVMVIATEPEQGEPLRLDPLDAGSRPDALRERIAEAGVVGLGGAAFPTAAKLADAPRAVILNGVECEPLIACDQRLLQERAAAVIAGGELLRRACSAERLLIAIEDDMPAARDALLAARHAAPPFELHELPARYPQGAERPLIETLLGIELPRGGLPRDVGVAVFNVGTAEAVWRAVVEGRPLTHRLVSVAGHGVREPVVLEAAIGTPVAALLAAAGGVDGDATTLLGGPLTGRPLADPRQGLAKGDNAVVVLAAQPAPPEPLPCIRCGACAGVCPVRLQPQLLWQFRLAGRSDRLLEHGLFDCIECAACDLVCPSHLPLTAGFAADKRAQRLAALQREAANAARERFEQRRQRLEAEHAERETQRAEQQRRLLASDAVRAALQRARSRQDGDGG